MESLFGQLENGWPALRSKLASWSSLSPKDCEELQLFIAAQRARVPCTRDMMEAFLAHKTKEDLFSLVEHGELDPPPTELASRLDELIVSILPEKSIEGIPHIIRAMGKIFQRVGLKIIKNETNISFITSDNPVCVFDPSVVAKSMQPYVLRAGGPIELIFPVDQKTLVLGHTEMRENYLKHGPRRQRVRESKIISSYNVKIAKFAYHLLIGGSSDHRSLLKAFSDNSPVLQNVSGWSRGNPEGVPVMGFGERYKKPKWTD